MVAAGVANFLSFMALNARLGGDALNGYEESGRYYVSDRGETTEVSEAEWRQSRSRGISLLATHPLMMAAMFYLLIGDIFPKMIFRGQREVREQKEAAVRSFDTPKLTFSCAGKIGALNFSGPLLRVAVYPKGIHFKPVFLPAFGLLASEIVSIKEQRSFFQKGIEIVHSSSEVASPIFLGCANNQAAMATLTSVV